MELTDKVYCYLVNRRQVTFYSVLLTVTCSMSVCGRLVHFGFSERTQILVSGVYGVLLTFKCLRSF